MLDDLRHNCKEFCFKQSCDRVPFRYQHGDISLSHADFSGAGEATFELSLWSRIAVLCGHSLFSIMRSDYFKPVCKIVFEAVLESLLKVKRS